MTIRRVKQATLNASDVAYKGMKNKAMQMEAKRAFVVNQQAGNIDYIATVFKSIKIFFIALLLGLITVLSGIYLIRRRRRLAGHLFQDR